MFERWSSLSRTTFAYRLFKQHHDEINRLYIAHMLSSRRTLNFVKRTDKQSKLSTVFSIPKKYAKHAAPDLERWEKDFKQFNNWVRLSAAVAINAYMEIYLRSACTLAIESNPGIIIGAPGAIDGVKLLKSRERYSYAEYAVHFVKGDWNTRLLHYEKLFGPAPETLKSYVKDLNELRKVRNGVGHSFGRSVDDYVTGLAVEMKPMMRLSEQRFGEWLRMADEVTSAIDRHLMEEHIGQYEMLLYYHNWLHEQKIPLLEVTPALLQQAIRDDTGEPFPLAYLKELIAYYHLA